MSFASKPPAEGNYLTAELWDIMNPNWRAQGKNITPLSEEANEKILKHVKGFTEAQTLSPEMMLDPTEEIDNLSIQRLIQKKRGSWYQIPKDYEND